MTTIKNNLLKTKENFIKKGKEKYNDTHGYDKVEFVNYNEKVFIICKKHNHCYLQTPKQHLIVQGCPLCRGESISKSKLISQEEVIKRSILTHGDKYDYSKVVYLGNRVPIEIYCKIHQEYFWQLPIVHTTQKCGCPKCGVESTSNFCRSNLTDFIEKARKVHGDKYDYSRVVYVNSNTKIIIVCPVHGEFEQIPISHLRGCNCAKCHFEKMSSDRRSTTKEFIEKAIKIHGNRYGYDKVIYKTVHENILIYCKVHKKYFPQSPANHFRGQGCPFCSESKGERMVTRFLDKNKIKYFKQYIIPNTGRYRYDFYLPEYNLFIEYHGTQHYIYSEFFHQDKDGFDRQLFRDNYKIELAKAWKIKLITIKYTVDTQEKIDAFLNYKLAFLY